MARKRPEEEKEARKLYAGGMKLKDIAKKIDKPEGTIRRWKCDYGWDEDQSERSDKIANARNRKRRTKRKPSAEVVEEVVENGDLTDKQRLFCVLYTRCFNATKAYQKAYEVDYATAASNAYRMMENDGVKNEIIRLKKNRLNREILSEEDIVQMYIDILYADIGDYLDKKHNMINLSGPYADGRLIKKVSFGKTDSIELLDKMAALKWLADHMDLATERQRAEIELLKAKTAREDVGSDEVEDDGFLDALNGSAQEDWKSEED